MEPIILAIDTSTEACSVALGLADRTLSRYEVEPRKHTELTLPMVEALLAEAGITLQAVNAIAFVRGPGAFTGLRIAAGIVQGLAYGIGAPVISISSLAVLAHRAYREQGWQHVHAAIDARMSEVYWGSYHVRGWGQVELLGREVVCAPTEVAVTAALPAAVLASGSFAGENEAFAGEDKAFAGIAWAGCGSGWIHEASLLTQVANVKAVWMECLPHGIDVIALARAAWQRGETVPAEAAQPVYLRDNVVQVRAKQ